MMMMIRGSRSTVQDISSTTKGGGIDKKRNDPVLYQFNIRQEEVDDDNNDEIVLVLFFFSPPPPPLQHEIHIDKRKGRIIHRMYYTIHTRGGTLFCRKIYSYHALFLSSFSLF